jgi:hypothetical protein
MPASNTTTPWAVAAALAEAMNAQDIDAFASLFVADYDSRRPAHLVGHSWARLGQRHPPPQLAARLPFVRDGDSVVVHSMDRLARNLEDLRRLVRELTSRRVCVEFVKERLVFSGEDARWRRCCCRCWTPSRAASALEEHGAKSTDTL